MHAFVSNARSSNMTSFHSSIVGINLAALSTVGCLHMALYPRGFSLLSVTRQFALSLQITSQHHRMVALIQVDDKKQELLAGTDLSIPIASSYSNNNSNDDAGTNDATRPQYDALGFQLHAWSHPLKSVDDRCGTPRECRYSYLACFPMAQIESRLGIATYSASLAFYCSVMTLQLAFTLLLTLCLEWFWMYIAVLPLVVICVVSLLLMLGLSGVLKVRIMAARRQIRERFLIPGDDADDRSVVNWHEGQAIRQMARHVQCDRTRMTERVETIVPVYPLH